MNIKHLNIGIANLVEKNGELELLLHESKESANSYRKWWEQEREKNNDLEKQIAELKILKNGKEDLKTME